MKEEQNSEKLIGELIKKRKEENQAFIKLLHAIENKPENKAENKTQDSNGNQEIKNTK